MPTLPRRRALQGGLGLLALAAPRLHAQTPPAQGAREAQAPPLPAIGSALALPEAVRLDGAVFRPADAEGRVLVLYWWASWCPFCAVVSPLMDRLWREQAPRGLGFLGLSIDRTPQDARAYLDKRGFGFPSAWVTPALARALPKPRGLPVTLVRGRDGRVLMAEAGQLFPEDVAEIARFL